MFKNGYNFLLFLFQCCYEQVVHILVSVYYSDLCTVTCRCNSFPDSLYIYRGRYNSKLYIHLLRLLNFKRQIIFLPGYQRSNFHLDFIDSFSAVMKLSVESQYVFDICLNYTPIAYPVQECSSLHRFACHKQWLFLSAVSVYQIKCNPQLCYIAVNFGNLIFITVTGDSIA